jgi:uncharacterized repeat protein (TIGR03987 family)
MFAALAFYSAGVWQAFFAGHLKAHHVVFYWLGLLCDLTGTELMRRLAGGLRWNFHTATGVAALVLMLVHASWATRVLRGKQQPILRTFPRISVTVWAIWLIPFITGLILGSRRGP